MEKINLQEKFELIQDHWSPRVIGELNQQYVKLAKIKGEFVWHDHKGEDELFLIVKGSLKLEFRDRVVKLKEGEICIVPRGIEHRPVAEEECHILLFEPKNIAHTGEVKSDLTQEEEKWI